ncbi:MAG: TerD family protein, partial [Turicibacter sp.]
MAINLGGSGINVTNTHPSGVTLNLQKNQLLDLTKREPGLTRIKLGAGWDVSQTGQSFDLDIAAFLLDSNGKFNSIENVIFFNNKVGQGIQLMGDNLTGVGEGDDEEMKIDLSQINPLIEKIVFVVTIHNAFEKRQTFGMVQNSYVRLVNEDQGNKEICKFN